MCRGLGVQGLLSWSQIRSLGRSSPLERERVSDLFKETEHLCLRQPMHGIGCHQSVKMGGTLRVVFLK